MSKAKKIAAFDPNGPGDANAGVFGLPFTCEEADIVLVPVPWEVTTSYGGGTSRGPEAIQEASLQVDLHHPEFPDLWKRGIAMAELPASLAERSERLKEDAAEVIEFLAHGGNAYDEGRVQELLERVNKACATMNDEVQRTVGTWLDKGKLVGLVGGDHSTPLGMHRALAERHDHFGILHIDAHMDFRNAYEGFTYSHASIMRNALDLKAIKVMTQVGIRDLCQEEHVFAKSQGERVRVFHYADLMRERYTGHHWADQVEQIIGTLPEKVHISFDIDGLDPKLCPNTGTPVPGGLEFEEATYLLSAVARSGKQIIGFDLVEVSPGQDEWDANVGARMLYHLCGVLGA